MKLRVRLLSAIAVAAFAMATPGFALQFQPRIAQNSVTGEPVDINTASINQLMKIPGLPRTWAARIIRFRPYRGKNELIDRGVVSAEVYARIKDRIIAHRQAR